MFIHIFAFCPTRFEFQSISKEIRLARRKYMNKNPPNQTSLLVTPVKETLENLQHDDRQLKSFFRILTLSKR